MASFPLPVEAGRGKFSAANPIPRLLHHSSRSSSVSIPAVHTPASLATENGGASGTCAWNRQRRTNLRLLSVHGKAGHHRPITSTMSAALQSAVPEISGSNVVFRVLEEELVEGCRLQHGQMAADGVEIHFVEAGDPAGKLVLLVHGFPNFWYVWKNQFLPLVEAGYHVIAMDLRGYNTSSKPETVQGYVRDEVLSDLVKLVEHFGNGEPAALVGHDWGAIISWAFAEDYPEMVDRLVTVNMGRLTDFQKILGSSIKQLLKSWYIGVFQLPTIAQWLLAYDNLGFIRKGLKNGSTASTDEDIRRHEAAYSTPGALSGGTSYYRAAFQGLWNRQDGVVPVVKIPVTVLWGDRDQYLLPIIAETEAERAPRVTVVHLPGSAHWPMWDEPKLFNELILKAIAEDTQG